MEFKFDLDTKDLIEDLKSIDPRKEPFEGDLDCLHCGKTIKNILIKDKKHYTCPFCKKEFILDYSLNK